MTLERAEGITPESLAEVRDRPLTEAYRVHDVGHDMLVARLERAGYTVVDHGDDARHADEIFYGDGPDVAVFDVPEDISYDEEPPEEYLVGYIEIKCKESAEWFGRCNLRHFREYVSFASDTQVPVFIWFAYLDSDNGHLYRDAFFPVEDTDQIDGDLTNVSEQNVVFEAGDSFEVNDTLRAVSGEDVIGVERSDAITDYIPEVHGNEVVELDEKRFRSFSHVQRQFGRESVGVSTASHTNTLSVDERIEEVVRATTPDSLPLRELLADQLVVNPAYPDIVQIRTNKGRMGPEITEDTPLSFAIAPDGLVYVSVEHVHVTLGTLD
jgi:hypothetical protein